MPKVVLSPGKSGSFDVTSKTSDAGGDEVAGLNSEKDGSKFVKLKMPKLQFTSPYSKNTSEEEHLEVSTKLVNKESARESMGISGKTTFSGFTKKTEKTETETERQRERGKGVQEMKRLFSSARAPSKRDMRFRSCRINPAWPAAAVPWLATGS